MKKIILAVGRTLGHQVFAGRLREDLGGRDPSLKVSVAGSGGSFTPPAASLSLKKPLQSIVGCYFLASGVLKSLRYLRGECPDLLVGFGSYATFPLLAAAVALRIPYILHEQNRVPGRVNRFFAKKALFTALNMPLETPVGGKSFLVDIPMGKRLFSAEEAKRKLGFEATKPLVLIFGGSQGAAAINKIVFEAPALPFAQVIHLTGSMAWSMRLKKRYNALGIKSVVRDFSLSMELFWSAADMVISRAGAGTISEMLHFEVPALFIPYPFASDNHQQKNADFVVGAVGGGIWVKQEETDGRKLAQLVEFMLREKTLGNMRRRIKEYNKERKKDNFGEHVLRVLWGNTILSA